MASRQVRKRKRARSLADNQDEKKEESDATSLKASLQKLPIDVRNRENLKKIENATFRRGFLIIDDVATSLAAFSKQTRNIWPLRPVKCKFEGGYASDISTSSDDISDTDEKTEGEVNSGGKIAIVKERLTPMIMSDGQYIRTVEEIIPNPQIDTCSKSSISWHKRELEYQITQAYRVALVERRSSGAYVRKPLRSRLPPKVLSSMIKDASRFLDKLIVSLLLTVGLRIARGKKGRLVGWEAAVQAAKSIETPESLIDRVLVRMHDHTTVKKQMIKLKEHVSSDSERKIVRELEEPAEPVDSEP